VVASQVTERALEESADQELALLVTHLTDRDSLPRPGYQRTIAVNEALCEAVKRGDIDAVAELFLHGVLPDADQDRVFVEVVHGALQDKSREPLIELFLKAGDRKALLSGALWEAVVNEKNLEITAKLIQLGADPLGDESTLAHAIETQAEDLVDLIYDYSRNRGVFEGRKRNRSFSGSGALEAAAQVEDPRYLERLLGHSRFTSEEFDSALSTAARSNNVVHLEILLSKAPKKASLNEALNAAAYESSSDVIAKIFEFPDRLTREGINEAAVTAAREKDLELLRELVLFGAEPAPVRRQLYGRRDRAERTVSIRYLELAEVVMSCRDAADPAVALEALFQSGRKTLKSDALQKERSFSDQHLVRCALWTAHAAALLGHESDTAAGRRFRELMQQDIERVESTTGLSWKKYEQELSKHQPGLSDLRDAVNEVAEACVLPLLLQERFEGRAEYRKYWMSQGDLTKLRRRSERIASRLVCSDKSTLDTGILNKRWHKPGNRLPDELRPYKLEGSWDRLFEGVVELGNGYSLVSLGTPSELRDEGSEVDGLDHCVGRGSYSTECLRGSTHILSLRKNGVRAATIEISATSEEADFQTPDGTHWRRGQFQGQGGRSARKPEKKAWREFLKMIEEDKIELSSTHGRMIKPGMKPRTEPLREFELAIGYDIEQFETVIPALLKHYEDRVVISRKNGCNTPLVSAEQFRKGWKKGTLDFLSKD
jgi:hypothetical protein